MVFTWSVLHQRFHFTYINCLNLEIIGWVPVYVIEDQSGCSNQVQSHPTRLGAQQKHHCIILHKPTMSHFTLFEMSTPSGLFMGMMLKVMLECTGNSTFVPYGWFIQIWSQLHRGWCMYSKIHTLEKPVNLIRWGHLNNSCCLKHIILQDLKNEAGKSAVLCTCMQMTN